jgi:hypothetical protein
VGRCKVRHPANQLACDFKNQIVFPVGLEIVDRLTIITTTQMPLAPPAGKRHSHRHAGPCGLPVSHERRHGLRLAAQKEDANR